MIFSIQTILLLSLLSPVTEAFPNLYMSWWVPTNGKLKKYKSAWLRRVFVVLLVWVPILITLGRITDSAVVTLLIAMLIFSAFGLRLYVFEISSRKNKIPELLYVIAFSAIGISLYSSVSDMLWLVPASIACIFFGAAMISRFRQGIHRNLLLDNIGRSIFIVGFISFLYNLSRAIV